MKSRRTLVIISAALVAVLIFAIPVLAGNNKGKGNASPTLSVAAVSGGEAVAVAADMPDYLVSGEGYRSGAAVFVVFDAYLPSLLAQADKVGSISTTWTPPAPGTYTLTSYQRLNNGKWVMGAQTVVDVR